MRRRVKGVGGWGGGWPRGLWQCNENQKVPGSNPTRHSAKLRDPTLLWGSRWLWVKIVEIAVINAGVINNLFLVLHFPYYTLMTFLMMLSVILLSILILLPTLNVIIWSVATTRIGFWTWIWHSRLGQEVACSFQCWKNSTNFIWPV